MIRIGILGEIGSGKSYVAKEFGYPVFNADLEVSKIYKKDKEVFFKLNKKIPKHILSFPVEKKEIIKAILSNKTNLKKIVNIIHYEIKKKLKLFLNKNRNRRIVILDIPLLLENKINNKRDILVYVDAKRKDIKKRLNKRPNFNHKLLKKFKKIQIKSINKKKRSNFIITNNFTKKSVKIDIKNILKEIFK